MGSEFWAEIRAKAAEGKRSIAFPDSEDKRVLEACVFLAGNNIVKPVLVGDPEKVTAAATDNNLDISGIDIDNPSVLPETGGFAETLYRKRQGRGMSEAQAFSLVNDPLYWSCMALNENRYDGVVAGARRTTADTIRAGLYCLGMKKTIFGFFVIDAIKAVNYGENGRFIFADCACMPEPTGKQLANIAIESARVAAYLLKTRPRVALLSFSTYGSASHERVDLVREAVELARQMDASLDVAGELQADAALDLEVAKIKGAADSDPVAGMANVLVFPNLESGNIAYKLVQRLGMAKAVGPVLWGFNRALSDLSRGCSKEDVIDTAATLCYMLGLEKQ